MEVVRLTSEVYDVIIGHARANLPAEVVGLLGGPMPGYATLGIPLPNLAGQNAFLADPYAQFNGEQRLARLGLQLVAVYHSHPGGGAQLSPLDLIFARKRGCIQILIALERPDLHGEEIRAYRVIENMAVEVEVCIEA
jgi:proteasome lid subunit RPN8/RPN11